MLCPKRYRCLPGFAAGLLGDEHKYPRAPRQRTVGTTAGRGVVEHDCRRRRPLASTRQTRVVTYYADGDCRGDPLEIVTQRNIVDDGEDACRCVHRSRVE